MRTYIADLIPKIQRFSQKLDDLTKLTNQHWVSLGDIKLSKKVYIFRPNNQLIISENGIVEKGSWEYLGNQSLLLDTKNESYLLKQGFYDENVIALKLDSSYNYAFFVNETKYNQELNNIEDVLKFLENKYINSLPGFSGLGSNRKGTLNKMGISYEIISEKESYYLLWGSYTVFRVKFDNGTSGLVYKGGSTGKYFYTDIDNLKSYCKSFEDAVFKLFEKLKLQ